MTKPRRGALPGALSLLAVLAGTAVPAASLASQQAPFDDPAVLALVARASALWRNPPPVAYSARAQSRIYFYLDREGGGAPVPLRVDQAAVDVYRGEEGRTRQIVRAHRRRELLPVRDFEYYLDRLTIVQDGYGEQIEIGQGLDVRSVPHPLGSDASTVYRYRLADSLTMLLPRAAAPVRVYEVEVEPRRSDQPAFLGSLFVEGETGALARLEFSFTAAAYVDPRSDYVRVVLEHALWDEGYWLPYRQQIEVRRERPELDLPFGTVIRAVLQVASYDFEPELAEDFFLGPRVTFASPEEGGGEFDGGLLDELAEEGLAPVSMARLDAEARAAARTRLAGRLPRLRLHADRFSSVLRANRAEGLFLGGGASFSPSPPWPKLEALAGVGGLAGAGERRGSATWRAAWRAGGADFRMEAFVRQLRDLGPLPGAAGAVNTVATLFGRDYTDPWFARGGRATVEFGAGEESSVRLSLFRERHDATGQALVEAAVGQAVFRPVRAVEEGVLAGAEAEYARRWGGRGSWGAQTAASAGAARWNGVRLGKLGVRAEVQLASQDLDRRAMAKFAAGATSSSAPAHLLHFLGGAGTLPGHPFRDYAGSRYWLARGEASVGLVPGWVSARLIAGAGAVSGLPAKLRAEAMPESRGGWRLQPSRGPKGYAGVGLGLLRGLLRADVAWGLPGGRMELVVSAAPVVAGGL